MADRRRNWCFTVNNWTDEDVGQIEGLGAAYYVYGREVGEGDTPHLQGYVEFDSPKSFGWLHGQLPRAHLEGRRGTREQARDYCMKDGDYVTAGVWRVQGARRDLDAVRQAADDEGMRPVVAMYNAQQIRVASTYLTYLEVERDWKPEVTWIWGSTGSGKSRRARELTAGEDVYQKADNNKWWDGYDRHETVILDDFRDTAWSMDYMLRLLDRYGFRVEVKGGFRQMLARKIVITSVRPPLEHWMSDGREDPAQLLRRIDIVMCTDVQR